MDKLGLTSEQARKIFERDGPNVFKAHDRFGLLKLLLNQMRSPLVVLLFIAAVISLAVGEIADGAVIMVVIVFNLVLGFAQEYKAGKTIKLLFEGIGSPVKVIRDGVYSMVDRKMVVVGDLVRLEIGCKIPADGVLVWQDGLKVDESNISGESVGVFKKTVKNTKKLEFENLSDTSKLFAGTVVERGLADMLVLRTGEKSSIGRLVTSLAQTQTKGTSLAKMVRELSWRLLVVALILSLILVIGGGLAHRGWYQMLTLAVSLAVALVPEGMGIGLTVSLVAGMRRMNTAGILVRRLMAVETLGSVDTVCLDKTGTLTMGTMRVVAVTDRPSGVLVGKKEFEKSPTELVCAAIVCNDHRDPLEIAMDGWARRLIGVKKAAQIEALWQRIDGVPFDHKTSLIMTRHNYKGIGVDFLSGAPEVLLERCTLTEKQKSEWRKAFSMWADKGWRLVGFAKRDGVEKSKVDKIMGSNFEYLGVVAFVDPLRPGARKVIQKMVGLGLKVKLITGDYKETAWALLRGLNLVRGALVEKMVITGSQIIENSRMSSAMISEKVLFARVKPEQKLAIVDCLQKGGHLVAMMGDGMNDALALKKADVGVVVKSGTDVARDAGDIILVKRNLGVLLEGIVEGKRVLANFRRGLMYLMVGSFAGVGVIVFSLIFNLPMPLIPVQILWINLVSGSWPYVALIVDGNSLGRLEPGRRLEGLLDRRDWLLITLVSVSSALMMTVGFWLGLGQGDVFARTMSFAILGLTALLYAFSVKDLHGLALRKKTMKSRWLNRGLLLSGLLLFMAIQTPLGWWMFETRPLGIYWLIVVSLSVLEFGLFECFKRALGYWR